MRAASFPMEQLGLPVSFLYLNTVFGNVSSWDLKMNRHFLVAVLAIFSLLTVASPHAVLPVEAQPFKAIFFENFGGMNAFDDFDAPLSRQWIIYKGKPEIVAGGYRSSVLRLEHPQPGFCGFFKDPSSASLFLASGVTQVQQQSGCTVTTVSVATTTSFVDGMIEFDICFVNPPESGSSAILTFRMQSDDTYYALRLTNTRDWRCHFAKYTGCTWQILGTQSGCGIFQTGMWSHVVVAIGGPWFQCYKDGVQICKAFDDTWQRSTWGGTGVGLQNNYYNGVFYIDSFKISSGFEWIVYRGAPGQDPNSGRSAASMFFDHPSDQGDAAPFADVNSHSAYVKSPDTRCFSSGVIEFDIHFDNAGGQKAFLTFRMKSDNEYYALRLTSTTDFECYFMKQKGWGNFEILGNPSSKGIIPLQTWTHIRVVIDGPRLEAYMEWPGQCGTVNSLLICSAWVTEIDPCMPCSPCGPDGYVGIWGGIGFYSAYNRGLFHIDNVKIQIIN